MEHLTLGILGLDFGKGLSMSYPPFASFCLLAGSLLWMYLYLYLAIRSGKIRFTEMPLPVATGNIIWEFLWAFVFKSEHQLPVTIVEGFGFFCDIFIFYHLLRYNPAHQKFAFFRKYYRLFAVFGLVAWSFFIVFFKLQGYDVDAGANSAYMLAVIIGILYVYQFFSIGDRNLLSYRIGWLKFLGNGLYGVFMFMVFPENHFVLTLAKIG